MITFGPVLSREDSNMCPHCLYEGFDHDISRIRLGKLPERFGSHLPNRYSGRSTAVAM